MDIRNHEMKKHDRNERLRFLAAGIGFAGLLLLVIQVFADVPVMEDTNKEVTMDVFGIAGSTMTATGKELNYCFGEPGGVTGLSNGTKELQVGFYCQDIYPPSAVTNLTGMPGDYARTISLSWTAPGNDYDEGSIGYGSTEGKYELHYSSVSAYVWGGCPYQTTWSTSTSQGDVQVRTITGLLAGNTYYFWLKTADEELNWSDLSNKSTSTAQEVVLSVYLSTDTYNFYDVPVGQSTHTISVITVTNNGTVYENYGISCATTTPGSDWTPGVTGESPAYNKFILKSVFHETECGPWDFDTWDTVEEDIKWSQTTSTFTADDVYTGVNADIKDDDRNIWFRLEMPTSISTGEQQKITVTITAEENTE